MGERSRSCLRPFHIQSDSASRKPFATGLSFDWILLVFLLIVGRVDIIVFVLFLEAVGVRQYFCMAVENRLAALCFARSARAMHARARRTLVPASWGLWAFSRKPPKLRSWSCTQPRAVKATANVVVVRKMGSTPRAAAVV